MDRAESAAIRGVHAGLAFDAFHGYLHDHYGMAWPRHSYRQDKFWRGYEAIADLCVRNKWDVTDFVRQSFQYVRRTHYSITPWDIVNVARRYGGWDPRIEWEGLQSAVMEYERGGYSEEDILMNPFLEFPAWFRCLYPEEPSDKLFDTWGCLARCELYDSVRLREFARSVAPETFDRLEGMECDDDH